MRPIQSELQIYFLNHRIITVNLETTVPKCIIEVFFFLFYYYFSPEMHCIAFTNTYFCLLFAVAQLISKSAEQLRAC